MSSTCHLHLENQQIPRPTCGILFRWLANFEMGPSSQWIDPANIFIHNKYIDACMYTHLPVPSSLTATCLGVYVCTNSIRTFVHLCTNLSICLSIYLSVSSDMHHTYIHIYIYIYMCMQKVCTIWNKRAQIRSCLFSSCSPIDLTTNYETKKQVSWGHIFFSSISAAVTRSFPRSWSQLSTSWNLAPSTAFREINIQCNICSSLWTFFPLQNPDSKVSAIKTN